MQLSFLQSNWLRQYPFKAGCGVMDVAGNRVPQDLLAGLRISVTGSRAIYISKIVSNARSASIEFCSDTGFVGVANATTVESNQAILIHNGVGNIGTVTIGNADSWEINHVYVFDSVSGAVEPSTVTVVPKPAVHGILVKGKLLTGHISLTSTTIGISDIGDLFLNVLVPSTVASRQDRQSRYLTCDKPVIGGINSVVPDKNGNIDIYTVAPLVINNGVLSVVVPENHSLCKVYNIPPVNQTSTNSTPLPEATKEYPTWTQFLPPPTP